MYNDKIIASRVFVKALGPRSMITAVFMLHQLGGQCPHFSITGERHEKRELVACGQLLDEIREHFPQLTRFLPLHLSNRNGVPMHAVENGWYWLGKTKYQGRDNAALARHLRIAPDKAEALNFGSKEDFSAYVDKQRPRWEREAREAEDYITY